MSKRIKTTEYLTFYHDEIRSAEDFENEIKSYQELKAKAEGEVNVRGVDVYSDYPQYLEFSIERWETDEEMEARLEYEKKRRKQERERKKKAKIEREAREKKEFERLKKKYGKADE